MKECINCGKSKELSEFYKHKQMNEGRLNKCKCCCKSQSKSREERLRRDSEWTEKEKERCRKKYHRLYKGKHKPSAKDKRDAINRYNNKYPEKVLCKNKAYNLKPAVKGNHLHHWSYEEENAKDVIEVPVDFHYFIHRNIKYVQEHKCYETYGGRLLDTKTKHLHHLCMLKPHHEKTKNL